ncbi:MAG: heavy-metal-associated domain-containing protein, partial [Limisphaera sp.]|nr:heavy-metal-associated domain-containing protein [Limisphaera sp.]
MDSTASEHLTEANPESPEPAVTVLAVQGMNCQGCVRKVTEALQAVPAVDQVLVELGNGRATVRWRSGASPQPGVLVESLRRAGYRAEPLSEEVLEGVGQRVR